MRTTLAERLKEARRARGMTQAQVAHLAGITPAAIGNLEQSVSENKKTQHLAEIAKALHVRPEWLSDGTGPRDTADHLPGAVVQMALRIHKLAATQQDVVLSVIKAMEDATATPAPPPAQVPTASPAVAALIERLKNR